ncbi:MAG: NYN domain-containing protein [Marmoricola sp.]
MTNDSRRLAVLIDADNTSPKLTREMFEELASYGTLTVKRAYGDWTQQQLSGWKGELHKHAISPMQQFANTSGKNSTDSALIIDAMDLLYAGNLDGFVIVSSDADFTRLATRLRESGMTVYGLGQRKTPKPFQDACDKFTFLEVLREDTSSASNEQPGAPERASGQVSEQVSEQVTVPEPVRDKGHLESMLARALNRTASDDDDWSPLGTLGSHLNRTDPSFDPRTFGFAKLSNLVKDQPFLETKTVQNSAGRGELWVRLKRRGAARRSSAAEEDKPVAKKKAASGRRTTKKAAVQDSDGGV